MIHRFLPFCLLWMTFAFPCRAQDASPAPVPSATATEKSALGVTLRTEGPEPVPLRAGVPFTWKIILQWDNLPENLQPRIKETPTFKNLTGITSSTSFRLQSEGDRVYKEIVFAYRMTPEKEGTAVIGSAAVSFVLDGEENYLAANPVELPVQPEPFSWTKTAAKVTGSFAFRLLGILLLIGLFCVTVYGFTRRANVSPEEPATVRDPAGEALEAARKSRIEGDRKAYARALEQAVLSAWKERFPDVEPATLPAFQSRVDEPLQPVLKRFVENSEHVKYAPGALSGDALEQLWMDAHRLLNRPG